MPKKKKKKEDEEEKKPVGFTIPTSDPEPVDSAGGDSRILPGDDWRTLG
jgi:hypothetical protein